MKRHVTILVLLTMLSAGCRRHTHTPPVDPKESAIPAVYDHAWVMSSGWVGFMGAAIALTPDQYHYWFYSDVGGLEEPEYPITGTYTFSNGRLVLEEGQHRLYATSWVVVTNACRQCLWAERDVGDIPRMLIPDQEFDPMTPFRNQPKLSAEQPAAQLQPKGAPSG
jgi:hypothetical protein